MRWASIGVFRARIVAWWPAASLVCIVASTILVISPFATRALDRSISEGLITLIIVIGLYVFIGNSGVYSFGHITFMAVGAYATAILTMNPAVKHTFVPGLPDWLINLQIDPLPASLVGTALALVLAAALTMLLMRLSGLVAGIATLSVLVIFYEVIANASAYTGGRQTLIGVPTRLSVSGLVACSAVAIGIAYAFQMSRSGLLLRATREDAAAASSLGVHLRKERAISFILSAGIVAAGGACYAQALGTVSVDSFFLKTTFITIVMLVVGGVRSLSGAVMGVLVISILEELLRRLEAGTLLPNHWAAPAGTLEVVLGVLMLLMLILRPNGITGGREFTWPFPHCIDYGRPKARSAVIPTVAAVGRKELM
jgi:branched-chain amino acid transport system permease protein